MVSWVMLGLAAAGIAYQLATALLAGHRQAAPVAASNEAVTILKPLHGAEPHLLANLSTFLDQDYSGGMQLVCGVQDAADQAILAVDALRRLYPQADIALVVDTTQHGSNSKVSNLINMMAAAKHDLLVLSDSDMAVGRSYLARLASELLDPRTGTITCLYVGRGDAGRWSQLAAMGISYGFLPSVMLGRALGLAEPCMGSTIALRRETLAAIGGLTSVADVLADDYAIGAGVRSLGLKVDVSANMLVHACAETGFGELVRHELRWNATILRLDPGGFIGLGLMNPVPLALLAVAIGGAHLPGFAVLAAAVAARLIVAVRVNRLTAPPTGALWLLPARDCLTFGLFLATFFRQSVDWRGARLIVARDGRIRS